MLTDFVHSPVFLCPRRSRDMAHAHYIPILHTENNTVLLKYKTGSDIAVETLSIEHRIIQTLSIMFQCFRFEYNNTHMVDTKNLF